MKISDWSKRRFLLLLSGMSLAVPALSFGYGFDDIRGGYQRIRNKTLMAGTPLRNPAMTSRKEGHATIIQMKGQPGDLLKLNETATLILGLCDGRHHVQAIAAKLSSQFDVPAPRCLKDVIFVINLFQKYGIVSL